MNITDAMVDHFHRQGFFFMPCPFDGQTMDRIRELTNGSEEQFLNTDWSGHKALTCWFFMLSDAALELAEDPRLVSLAARLLGVDQVHVGTCGLGNGNHPMFGHGRDREKGLFWHSDGSPDIKQVSIRIAIDRHGPDEGGLRILPGSHLVPTDQIGEELVQCELASGEHAEVPKTLHCTHPREMPIVMDPRWTLVWTPSCWHATTPSLNGKRRCSICWNYFPPGGRATCQESVRYAFGETWQDWSDARKEFWGMNQEPVSG